MTLIQYIDRPGRLLPPSIALLGNEKQGFSVDFCAAEGYVRDRAEPENFRLANPNSILTYTSPSTKWIFNALGVLESGTTLRCDHDPATMAESDEPLNSMGVVHYDAIRERWFIRKSVPGVTGYTYAAGLPVRFTVASDISKWMLGLVVSHDDGVLVMDFYAFSEAYVSGSDWKICVALGLLVEGQASQLFTNTEFPNGESDAPVRGGLVGATSMAGFDGALSFGHNGSTTSVAYKSNATITASTTYAISFFVEMDDGLAPVPGTTTGPAADFGIVLGGAVITSGSSFVVKHVGGARYRVSAVASNASPTNNNAGIVKYLGNSSRTFKVTGYNLVAAPAVSSYVKATSGAVTRNADDITLPQADFPWASGAGTLYLNGDPVTPVTGATDLDITGTAFAEGVRHITSLRWVPA